MTTTPTAGAPSSHSDAKDNNSDHVALHYCCISVKSLHYKDFTDTVSHRSANFVL